MRSTHPSSRPTTSAASTPTRWMRDVAYRIGRAFPTCSRASRATGVELGSASGATCGSRPPSWRSATPRASDEGATCRRGHGGHRDALFHGRLAGAGGRADVHGVAQPEGLHGREARPQRRAAAVGRRGHRRDPRHRDRRRARAAGRRAGRAGAGGRRTGLSGARPCASSTRHGPTDERGAGRGERHGGPGGRPDARHPADRAAADLLGTGREVPGPRAEPAAAGEPPVHREAGPVRGRGAGHRLGRRRRPLLLHRRHGPVRGRRLPHRAPRRVDPRQGARGARSSTTCGPAGPCETSWSAAAGRPR